MQGSGFHGRTCTGVKPRVDGITRFIARRVWLDCISQEAKSRKLMARCATEVQAFSQPISPVPHI